jgi:hypothetical protein
MNLLTMNPVNPSHEVHRFTPFRVNLNLCGGGSRLEIPDKGKGDTPIRNLFPIDQTTRLFPLALCPPVYGFPKQTLQNRTKQQRKDRST